MWLVPLKQKCLLMVLVCSCRYAAAVVTDTTKLRFDPTNMSVLEGNNGTLTCTISISEPGLYFIKLNGSTFYVNPNNNCSVTAQLTNTQEYSVRCINEDVQITILNVSHGRHGEVWTCERNMHGTVYQSNSTITVRVPITNVRFETQRKYTKTIENTRTEFVCITSAGYPNATIHWYKNSTRLEKSEVSTSYTASTMYMNGVRSSLLLYPTRADNLSLIHCAANNNDTTWTYSSKTSMIVYYAPDVPIITKGASQVQGGFSVIKGNTVNIKCTANSFPEPTYSWITPHGDRAKRSLIISKISRNDSGYYTCEATNTMTLSSEKTCRGENKTSINIQVLYPPSQPIFKYRNANSDTQYDITHTHIYAVRNGSFKLTCTTDSLPLSTYQWTGYPHLQVKNTNTLTVISIQDDMNLTCTASNTMKETFGMTSTQSANLTIRIIILYPPEVIHLKVNGNETITNNNSTRVVEGSDVILSCDANSKPPPSNYTWYKLDSTTLQTAGLGEYIIVNINRNQTGRYTCLVKNVMNPSFEMEDIGTISNNLSLEVVYPTKIDTFEVDGHSTSNVTVNEKDNITLVCNVEGKPESKVSILYEDTPLKQATVTKNVNHTVTNITCVQHGQYACAAKNVYNTERPMKYLTLFVRCSPRPKPNSELQEVFASALNVDMTISFEVLTYPAPTDDGFKWEKEITNGSSWKEVKNNDDILISSSGEQSNLTLKNVSRLSFGNYRLNVTNVVGTYIHQFVLNAEEKPQSPTNFHHVEELTTNSALTFIWSPGFDGGPTQTFILRYRKTNSNDEWLVQRIPDNGRPKMNTTFQSLTSSTLYDVYLIASNEKGNSSAVEITAVQTRAAPPITKSYNGGSIIPTVSGVAASVVVLCVIVVIIVLYKRRQNQKDASKMHHGATTTYVSRDVYENVFSHGNDEANNDGTDNKSNIYQNVPDLHLPSSANSFKQSSSETQKAAAPVLSQVIYQNLLLKAV